MNTLRRIVGSAALAFAVAAAVTVAHAEELKIGAVGPLSGGGTDWGLALQRGVTVAMDEINAAGGVKVGATTYTLKMIMYDDQYAAQGGTTAATRLIEVDGVKFILGPVGSPPALGVVSVTGPAKVIALTDGYSPKILNADSKYNFRVQIPTEYFAPAISRWLRKTYPQATKVGFISPNDAVGQTLVPIHIKAYKDAGFETVSTDMFDRGLTDFSPLITRLMSRGADVFELDGNAPGDAGLMVKQARQLGYKGVIIQTGGPGVDEVIRVAGPFAEGFLTYDLFDPTEKAAQGFVAQYHAKFQGPINGLSPIWYNATKLLAEALRRAGALDTDKVRDALEHLDGFPSLLGPVKWDGTERYGIRHQLVHAFFISEVKNGKVVPVTRLGEAN
ncbi:MAG: ABC transporter substrate-binding protein [SAR324 cluster bacterium]